PNEAGLAAGIMDHLRRGERWEGEFPARHKDGGSVLVLVNLAPVHDEQEAVAGMAGVAVDITERRRQERRLAAQYAVTRTLSESEGIADAAPHMLAALCEALGWEVGALWGVDHEAGVLRLVALWHDPALTLGVFERQSREIEFRPGKGLPGRVWESSEP